MPRTVQPGNTLYQIGLYYGLTASQLSQYNGITNGVIYPGQVIKVPPGATSVPYSVQPGDSLYLIAGRFNVTVGLIAAYNGASESAVLYSGQTLTVPTGSWNVYAVQPGDSLYSMGVQSDVTASFLASINGLQSDTIYPAEDLFVPAKASGITYTAAEEDLLARLITAEADGEPFAAQVAVGAVVANRVKSPTFPNTITGVIYQIDPTTGAYQFTPVLNGYIDNPASASSITAAQDSLAGQDPTNGALYYFNSNVTNSWLQSLPVPLSVISSSLTRQMEITDIFTSVTHVEAPGATIIK